MSINRPSSAIGAGALIALYGLAGFGYIITATYLPLLVRLALPEVNIGNIWAVFGVSVIPSCFIWYRICQCWGNKLALTANMSIQAIGVALPVIMPNVASYLLSALCVGAGFMGMVMLVMPIAQQLSKDSGKNLIAIVTVAYSIGQIIAPLISAQLYEWTGGFNLSLLLAMSALWVGAFIAYRYA